MTTTYSIPTGGAKYAVRTVDHAYFMKWARGKINEWQRNVARAGLTACITEAEGRLQHWITTDAPECYIERVYSGLHQMRHLEKEGRKSHLEWQLPIWEARHRKA